MINQFESNLIWCTTDWMGHSRCRGWQLGDDSTIVIIILRLMSKMEAMLIMKLSFGFWFGFAFPDHQSVINHWKLDSKRLSGKQIILWPAIWIKKNKHKHIHNPWAFWFAFSSGLNEKRKCHLFYALNQHPHQSPSAKAFAFCVLLQLSMGGGALVFAYVLCF